MYNLGHVVCQKYRAKSAGGWFLLAVYSMYSFLYSESELNWIESEEKPVMLQAWLGVTQLAKILKKNEIAFLVVFQKLFLASTTKNFWRKWLFAKWQKLKKNVDFSLWSETWFSKSRFSNSLCWENSCVQFLLSPIGMFFWKGQIGCVSEILQNLRDT